MLACVFILYASSQLRSGEVLHLGYLMGDVSFDLVQRHWRGGGGGHVPLVAHLRPPHFRLGL